MTRSYAHRASAGLGITAALAAIGGVGWWGLQVLPDSFPPFHGQTLDLGTVGAPKGLPEPVTRFARVAVGDRPPIIESAILSGRGQLTLSGVTIPMRFRFTHIAGQGYRHYIECAWFGHPILKVNEWYIGGHARQVLPFGVVDNEPNVDSAANLNLWGEGIWFPSLLLGDPRVRWETIDSVTARLIVPFGGSDDSFTVVFSPESGLVQSMTAMRYRSAKDRSKEQWRMDVQGWHTFTGMRIPSLVTLTWLKDGKPWLSMSVEDAVFNADVSTYLLAVGP